MTDNIELEISGDDLQGISLLNFPKNLLMKLPIYKVNNPNNTRSITYISFLTKDINLQTQITNNLST